jgi:beta-adrenergic-receptor kinase
MDYRYSQQISFLQKMKPPVIPLRGQVNAMDVIDIQSLEHDDTKGVKLDEHDQRQYQNFPAIISERWQQEIVETVFHAINTQADAAENTRRKSTASNIGPDCILQGYLKRQVRGMFGAAWYKKYAFLFPDQLELYNESISGKPEVIPMARIAEVSNEPASIIDIRKKGVQEKETHVLLTSSVSEFDVCRLSN